jgi:HEAT repeat protein
MFDTQLAKTTNFHAHMLTLLQHDPDSGVRACVAFVCGQTRAHWAVPELILTLLDSDKYVAETALNALFQCRNGEDAILLYIFKELAAFSNPHLPLHASTHLSHTARRLLKNWQKTRRHENWAETYFFVPLDR